MKKKIEIDINVCDFCDDNNTYLKCSNCSKDICHECSKKYAKEFSFNETIYISKTNRIYCNDCIKKIENDIDNFPLYSLFKEIESLVKQNELYCIGLETKRNELIKRLSFLLKEG